MWGLAFALVGAVVADYSSYDESLAATMSGGIVESLVGAAIAVGLKWFERRET